MKIIKYKNPYITKKKTRKFSLYIGFYSLI